MSKIMRRVYRTGNFREVVDHKVGENARPRGATRAKRGFGTSRPEQIAANDKTAVRALTAIINGNFSYQHGDLWICLTLDAAGLCDLAELRRRTALFLRAAGRLAKKRGIDLRWIAAPADIDGDTGEIVRPHVHLILSGGLTTDELRRLWHYGTVDVRTLRQQKSHKALATYIIRQARHDPNAKKWTCSRNLQRTILVREYFVASGERYRLPPHAAECEREYDPELGKQLYLSYMICGGRKKT